MIVLSIPIRSDAEVDVSRGCQSFDNRISRSSANADKQRLAVSLFQFGLIDTRSSVYLPDFCLVVAKFEMRPFIGSSILKILINYGKLEIK